MGLYPIEISVYVSQKMNTRPKWEIIKLSTKSRMGKKTCVIIIPWNTTQAATAHDSLGGAMVSEKSRHRRICNA